MSLFRFPFEPESKHPQYLWNEQEYIIRMLTQNALGVGLNEGASEFTVSLYPNVSKNIIANGPADFPRIALTGTFPTNKYGWIYIKADGTEFYYSQKSPIFNKYIHGWYHPTEADRAVVFIDNEAPAGYRCIVMDSANAMFSYNRRIPDTGGEVVYDASWVTSPGNWNPNTITLLPGNYRFEVRGGRGGSGGLGHYFISTNTKDNYPTAYTTSGGSGADSVSAVLKLTILDSIIVNCLWGGNGNNGTNGKYSSGYHTIATTGTNVWVSYITATGGGGGASGQDSIIVIGSGVNINKILIRSYGGAGGGAGGVRAGRVTATGSPIGIYNSVDGGGGGGAGSGTAQDGSVPPYQDISVSPGRAGGPVYGGAPGIGSVSAIYNNLSLPLYPASTGGIAETRTSITYVGIKGEDISAGNIRKGGAGGWEAGGYGVAGGSGITGGSNGWCRIIRTKLF